jgi:hypothetical protein
MRYLLLLVLLLPTIVSANYRENYTSYNGIVVYDNGETYVFRKHVIITNDDICFTTTGAGICLPKQKKKQQDNVH